MFNNLFIKIFTGVLIVQQSLYKDIYRSVDCSTISLYRYLPEYWYVLTDISTGRTDPQNDSSLSKKKSYIFYFLNFSFFNFYLVFRYVSLLFFIPNHTWCRAFKLLKSKKHDFFAFPFLSRRFTVRLTSDHSLTN